MSACLQLRRIEWGGTRRQRAKAYTARNQIDQILLDGPPPLVDYSYNLRGLMTGKTYESGGLASVMAHDAQGQVLSLSNSSNAGMLDQLT